MSLHGTKNNDRHTEAEKSEKLTQKKNNRFIAKMKFKKNKQQNTNKTNKRQTNRNNMVLIGLSTEQRLLKVVKCIIYS